MFRGDFSFQRIVLRSWILRKVSLKSMNALKRKQGEGVETLEAFE
jgi:hypothetical protein